MFHSKAIFAFVALLLASAVLPCSAFSQAPVAETDIPAPFVYEGTMLVLVSDDGVAAVIFRPTAGGGAAYDYRYEGNDGKQLKSYNQPLFETRNPKGDMIGELYIKTGPISLGWSHGGDTKGWIYYTPEKVTVHLADAKDFADRVDTFGGAARVMPKLDLQRFRKRPSP